MRSKTQSQVNIIGGMNLDGDRRSLPANEMSYVNDAEYVSSVAGQDASVSPLPSSATTYTVPNLTEKFQNVRLRYDNAETSYAYIIYDSSGTTIFPATTIAVGANLTAHIVSLNIALGVYNLTCEVTGALSGYWFGLSIKLGGYLPFAYTIKQYEIGATLGDITEIVVNTLQESYVFPSLANAGNEELRTLQTTEIDGIQFVFSRSVDLTISAIGYATKNQSGTWAYVTLIQTGEFDFPTNKVIEIEREEINSGQYAFYWIDNNRKPKALYVPTTLGAYSCLKYNMSSWNTGTTGLFTLESLREQTDLQTQNYARVSYSSQLESGGALESATYHYFVSVGINNNHSEYSQASRPVMVFKASISAPSAGSYIGGDKTPEQTSKVNVLLVENAKATVYNKIRLACVINQGGAYSALLIGEYAVTTDSFYLSHTGNETASEIIDVASLPPVQEVFLSAKNIQVKKNRLNLACVDVANDANLESIFQAVTLGQTMDNPPVGSVYPQADKLTGTGRISFTSTPLFYAAVGWQYYQTSVDKAIIKCDNVSAPYYNPSGAFNTTTHVATIPAGQGGDYYLSMAFDGWSGGYYVSEVYIQNSGSTGNVKSLRYCVAYPDVNSRDYFVRRWDIATLEAYDELRLYAFFGDRDDLFGDHRFVILASTTFSAIKAIDNYPIKSLKAGEYQFPTNIANKLGYMINETYAYYGRVYYKNGHVSSWYYMKNYRFDAGTTFAPIINAYLADTTKLSTTVNTVIYALTIAGLDISSIQSEIYGVEIGRAICNPTVLGTGIFIAAHAIDGAAATGGSFKTGTYIGDLGGGVGTVYGNAFLTNNDFRYFGVMVCPDWILGDKPTFQRGDYIVNYGCPDFAFNSSVIQGANKSGAFREFGGHYSSFGGNPVKINVVDGQYVPFNTNSTTLKNDGITQYLSARLDNTGTVDTAAMECMAMTLDARIIPIATTDKSVDNGAYYVQYVRPNTNQYNSKSDTVVSTGHFIPISIETSTIPMQTVYGGDTYNQNTYVKICYNALNKIIQPLIGTISSFIGFLSQNKINSQLRYVDKLFTNLPLPFGTTLDQYLFGTYEAQEQFQIDKGYDWKLPVLNERPYDSSIVKPTHFGSRIYYSQEKPNGSIQDLYRTILPLDYKDLNVADGDINGLYDAQNGMVAIQARAVSILPYQADVMVSGTEIYVGNGGVYAQRENKVSTYGASFKSATLKAQNEAGNTQIYWYSDTVKKFMRLGFDGVKSLSDQDNFRTFLLNNTTFILNEFDIVMGFDANRHSVFVTARAENTDIATWAAGTTYTVGQLVRYGAIVTNINKFNNFEQLQDIYVAKGTTTAGLTPFDTPSQWTLKAHTDNTYYNNWSFIYNEKSNFLQTFFTALPERYFNHLGKLYVPRGISPYGMMFELFGGSLSTPLQWLSYGGTLKQGSFVVEISANNKTGLTALRFESVDAQVGMDHVVANNPSLTVSTSTQTSSMAAADWDFKHGVIGIGIFPDSNDEIIIGEYALVRLTSQAYYRVYGIVSHYYQKSKTIFR